MTCALEVFGRPAEVEIFELRESFDRGATLELRAERESTEMTSVILLFSLLTPDAVESYASELLTPESTEPHCDVVDEMLAKYDAEYEVERALEIVGDVFD